MKISLLRTLIFFSIIFLFIIGGVPKHVLAQTPPNPGKIDKSFIGTEEIPIPYQLTSVESRNASPSIDPIGLEDWSRIAFQSYRDGNWEIYFSQIDGQYPLNVTQHSAADARPNLNRGGTRIAFNSDHDGNAEIYTVNVDGSGLTRLTFNDASDYAAAWSPDGTQIVFISTRDGNSEIYKMNSDGSGLTRLTNSPHDDTSPIWSPNGEQIAWIRYSSPYGAIYVMSADGIYAHLIAVGMKYLDHIAWSPDGLYLAADFDADFDEWNELVWMHPDGKYQYVVYDAGQSLVDCWLGSWSPDSQWVIFSRIEYKVVDNQLYIDRAYLERVKPGFPSTGHSRLIGSGYDLGGVWQTTDIDPPSSMVNNLPDLSRASGFLVQWSGKDNGLAGISSYDLQYRAEPSEIWNNWSGYMYTTQISGTFTVGSPGEEIYFRSRARDRAENIEPWPTTSGDTWTKLFIWIFGGSITDNRGKSTGDPTIEVSPVPWETPGSDYFGNFLFHLKSTGTYILTANHEGYGTLPISNLLIDSDSSFELHLPPEDNLVKNGEFEEGDYGFWQITGTAQISIDNSLAHTGNASALLGYSPKIQTTNLSNSPDLSGNFGLPQLVRDTQGTLHAVWHDMSYQGFVHSQQQPNGTWTPPSLISGGINQDLAVGPDGTLHLVFILGGNEQPFYVSYSAKPLNGGWSSPINLSGNLNQPYRATIAVDRLGDVHVIWADTDQGLMYTTKPHSSSWSVPISIFNPGIEPELAVGEDNQLHLVWRNMWELYYSNHPAGGAWSQPLKLADDPSGSNNETLVVDIEGNIHLSWVTTSQVAIKYAWKSPTGSWSTPVIIADRNNDEAIYFGRIAVGSEGYLHLVWSTGNRKTCYRVRYPDGLWSIPIVIRERGSSAPNLWADDKGLVQLVWIEEYPYYTNTEVFYSSLLHPEIIDGKMSQSIEIVEPMHRPTLSFTYRLEAYNGTGANLTVNINHSPVFTITNPSQYWAYGWVDLSSWSGQSITLTIMSHGTATDGYTNVHLDEISLGSWLTPIVDDVEPSKLEVWASKTITITGDNFVSIPKVYLDKNLMTSVVIMDEHTLQVTLPADLAPGIYDVWVENPGGQRGVLGVGLRLGKFVYLPLMIR